MTVNINCIGINNWYQEILSEVLIMHEVVEFGYIHMQNFDDS